MSRRWIVVVAASMLVCTLLELVVMQGKYQVFTGGFLVPEHVKGAGIPAFLFGSLVLDAAVVTIFCAPALWLADRFRRGRRTTLGLAAAFCIILVQAGTIAYISGIRLLGDALQYRFFPGVSALVLGVAGVAAAAAACIAVAVLVARRLPDRLVRWLDAPQSRRRVLLSGAAVVVAGCALMFIAPNDLLVHWRRKTTGRWMYAAINRATDFDGDTWGLVGYPHDHAPFDGDRNPAAVDRPGNGIDENGVRGDLDRPGDFSAENYGEVRFVRRPDVLLIVLESFRPDNLEAVVDGKPVAPRMRKLIAEGALHGPAYSHNAFTSESLEYLFGGRITATPGTTLVDDFNQNGYLTACFSAEDESFGKVIERTGLGRVDYYIDARHDVARRAYPSSAPASLVVGWKVVADRIDEFLAKRATGGQPVFAYINLQDCHFPYAYPGQDKILCNEPLSRREISKENAARLIRTYRNASANVDRAVGVILDKWEAARGKAPAFVIVSDHGESLFDNDVLGHGLNLCEEQTRINFLVGGLDVECVFPCGQAEVRGLLRRALATPAREPTSRIDPGKWVFQYIGSFRAPRMVGAAFARGGLGYRFADGANIRWGEPPKKGPDFVRHWERIILHRYGAR